MSRPARMESYVKAFDNRLQMPYDLATVDSVGYDQLVETKLAYWRYRNCGIFRGPANRFSITARHRAPPSTIAKAIERKMLDRMFASGNSWHQLIAHQNRLIVRQKRVLRLLDVDIDRAVSANRKSAYQCALDPLLVLKSSLLSRDFKEELDLIMCHLDIRYFFVREMREVIL